MLTDPLIVAIAAMMMTILSLSYANDCEFKLKDNEKILFASFTPFSLNCIPEFKIDHEICTDNKIPFKWTHDNREIIPREGKIKFTSSSQILIVFNGSESDEGVYKCSTINNINRIFNVTLTSPSMMQKNIFRNVFPNDPPAEIKGQIYWLPEMMMRNIQQRVIVKQGGRTELFTRYYVSIEKENISEFDVQWHFQTYETMKIEIIKVQLHSLICNKLDFLPRYVSGLCYESRIYLEDLTIKNQGFYVSVAKLVLKNGRQHYLNLTYELGINAVDIFNQDRKDETYPQLTFNQDARICTNDYYEWNCKVSPDINYATAFYKVKLNSNYTLLEESEFENLNFTDESNKSREGTIIKSSQIHYLIKAVKKGDAGVYGCCAIEITKWKSDWYIEPEMEKTMRLIVHDCLEKEKLTSEKSESVVFTWIVGAIVVFIVFFVIFVLFFCRCFKKYSNSYLVKTVIVQHPNKLYVPHDTCFPLIMPDVTIKTTHKHSSEDSLLQQKHFSRLSNIPFSQKLSKYLRKSFIFSYRHVDITGSNPDSPNGALSNTETNKMTSNSLTVEEPRPQLILQNDAHTKYILPSNIGWIFSRESLMIGSKIGEGAFGIVYSALVKPFSGNSPPNEVAIKTLHTSFGDEDVINLIQELEMMKIIGRHKHIISLYGACVDNGHPYMVIELAKYGNLRDFLRARRNQLKTGDISNIPLAHLTIADLLRFSLEIAVGMEYLSSRMIIHRDLAARNVLVDQDLKMKIADFGLTRSVEHYYRKTTDGRLPIKWMAPECLLDRIYTVKSDVWSFGIVLWEIFTMGQTPYPTIQSDAMHQALRNGVRNEKPALASDEMYRLLLTIWNDDPQDRHSFSELVDKLTHIQQSECGVTMKRDYLEISNNQWYSTTIV